MQVKTPGGTYYPAYKDMLLSPHILIAGSTGSGKSVLLNTFLYSALTDAPFEKAFYIIDPKRVDLAEYKNILHTIDYAQDSLSAVRVLRSAVATMENRYKQMALKGQKLTDSGDIYIVIDELADLLLSDQKKTISALVQKIAQLGRAAKVHLLMATQSPARKILPAEITLNITDRIALRCQSAIESRQIIGVKGAENLKVGQMLYSKGADIYAGDVPMVPGEELRQRISYWSTPERYLA